MQHGLVTTQWLAEHLKDSDVKLLDATYFLPNEAQNAREHFISKHISHAQFFDVDECCDKTNPSPHMLPSEADFSAYMQKLGISNDDTVIIYDAKGLFSAARVWWMLRGFGHESARVAVLDGGLPKWEAEGYPCVSGQEVTAAAPAYIAKSFDASCVCGVEDILHNITTKQSLVLDARGAARFLGSVPEPRAGVRSGHIPSSVNVPYTQVLDAPYYTMKSPDALRVIFANAGVSSDTSVITSCGSGVTACVLVLALHQLGFNHVRVYDGSWSQWGALDYTPVVAA